MKKTNNVLLKVAAILGLSSTVQAGTPKTLFELSGVQRPRIDLDHSILVIIDAQEEYRTGRLPLAGIKLAIQSIQGLLAQARKKKIPIIHVQHKGSPGGLFDPYGKYFEIISELAPQPDELIILKNFPNAFAETSLAGELEKMGRDRTLVFVGFMTHMCITTTASTALDLGYQNVIVKDAVATRDLKGPNGETIPAEVVNQLSLAALQDRIAWLVETRDLLQ